MIRKYHNHKRQTTSWHREEEPLNHQEIPGRLIKQSNQLSLPHQDDGNKPLRVLFTYPNKSDDNHYNEFVELKSPFSICGFISNFLPACNQKVFQSVSNTNSE